MFEKTWIVENSCWPFSGRRYTVWQRIAENGLKRVVKKTDSLEEAKATLNRWNVMLEQPMGI